VLAVLLVRRLRRRARSQPKKVSLHPPADDRVEVGV
jgi:hypothetical protein